MRSGPGRFPARQGLLGSFRAKERNTLLKVTLLKAEVIVSPLPILI